MVMSPSVASGTIPDGVEGEGRPAAVISAQIPENSIFQKNAGRPFACPQTKTEIEFSGIFVESTPSGVDRSKQAVLYKGDMKREWLALQPKPGRTSVAALIASH